MSVQVAAPSAEEVKAAPREYALFVQAEPAGEAVPKQVGMWHFAAARIPPPPRGRRAGGWC